MEEFKVEIPEDKPALFKFKQDELPGIVYVNTALSGFEPKQVFAWHLTVYIIFETLVENGMPSIEEREIVDPFGDGIEKNIRGNFDKPNALFLARVTWNGTRELIFRVFDPEVANDYLQNIIASKDYPRELSFRMEEDPDWKETTFFLHE